MWELTFTVIFYLLTNVKSLSSFIVSTMYILSKFTHMSTTILDRSRGSMDLTLPHTHLTDDVPVGEADDHPVLGCIVFVLVLDDQAFAGKVVSFSL